MAKRFLDATIANAKDDIASQDGSALTLTGVVRVLYEDTTAKLDLINALEKCTIKLREELAG
jgi:hypothetical protein